FLCPARLRDRLGEVALTSHPLPANLPPGRLSFPTKEGQTMLSPTESKPQGWRALAVFDDRPERLLYLGRSASDVRAGYATAFYEVLDEEERAHVRSIALQHWNGEADAGHWVHQATLSVPTSASVTQSA